MSVSREQLIEELRSREYREAYAESFLNHRLTTQIRVIRDQRGWTQKDLAKRIGKHQPGLSRIEDSQYGKWNAATLREVAAALDTWLDVRLESYGKLPEEALAVSPEALQRPTFAEDQVFWTPPRAEELLREYPDSGPTGDLRGKLLPWLEDRRWHPEPLTDWLQGRGLVSFGHEDEPYRWFLRAVPADNPRYAWHRLKLASRVAKVIDDKPDIQTPGPRPEEFLSNLFLLAGGLDSPDLLAEPLYGVYRRLRRGAVQMEPAVRDCLLAALTRNQKDLRLYEVWVRMLETGAHDVLPGNEYAGFEGIKWLPPRPAPLDEIAYAIKLLERLWWKRGYEITVAQLVSLLSDVRQLYGEEAAGGLQDAAYKAGWNQAALTAWRKAFSPETDPAELFSFQDPVEIRFRASTLLATFELEPQKPDVGDILHQQLLDRMLTVEAAP